MRSTFAFAVLLVATVASASLAQEPPRRMAEVAPPTGFVPSRATSYRDVYAVWGRDASGRRVRTLVDGWREAGEHSVRWTGVDDQGGRVGAGVYFCRIEAGQFAATRRVARMQ